MSINDKGRRQAPRYNSFVNEAKLLKRSTFIDASFSYGST